MKGFSSLLMIFIMKEFSSHLRVFITTEDFYIVRGISSLYRSFRLCPNWDLVFFLQLFSIFFILFIFVRLSSSFVIFVHVLEVLLDINIMLLFTCMFFYDSHLHFCLR